MKKLVKILFLALLTPLQSFAAQEAAESASGIPDSLINYIDGVAEGESQTLGIPGIGVSIFSKEYGSLVRAWGRTDVGGVRAFDAKNEIIPVASISKVFVAVALMRAQEQGIINLDDPINDHLDFKLPVFPGARPMTIRDVTSHEGGFEERWLATGAGRELDPRPWSEIMAATYPQLIAPPESYSSYSNYGIALLGYMLEYKTGIPYHAYLKAEVLDPLGMTNTTVEHPAPADFEGKISAGLRVSGGVERPARKTFNYRTYPAGRLVSTLPDMNRFIYMIVNDGVAPDGTVVLQSDSVEKMLDASRKSHPSMPGLAVIFAEKDIQGTRFIGHGGDGGTHHTDMIISREHGFGLFVNFMSAPGPQARDYFTRAIVPKFTGTRFDPLPLADNNQQINLSRFTGEYRHYRWAFTSIEKLLGLTSQFSIGQASAGSLMVKGRLGAGEYVPVDINSGLYQNRVTGEYLHFFELEDGSLNVVMGSFPFVTAFKLDTADTQGFVSFAFDFLMISLGLAAVVLATQSVRSIIARTNGFALGQGLLAIASGALVVGSLLFLETASSLSEAALQQSIPESASTFLAIPFLSIALLFGWVIGYLKGLFRAPGWFQHLAAIASITLVVLFLLFIDHWNALGWNYP